MSSGDSPRPSSSSTTTTSTSTMATPQTSSASPAGPGSNPTVAELFTKQSEYFELRHKVALGMLFVAPALIALPPRKLDFYTFGLGFAWVYCLNDVAKYHGTDLLHVLAGGKEKYAKKAIEMEERAIGGTAGGGWKGESVLAQYREKEDEGKGISEIIGEAVWDVWQQRDKRKLTPEQEEEEDLPLKERLAKLEKEKKKEREAVDEFVKTK